jgi:hypothetical protein
MKIPKTSLVIHVSHFGMGNEYRASGSISPAQSSGAFARGAAEVAYPNITRVAWRLRALADTDGAIAETERRMAFAR